MTMAFSGCVGSTGAPTPVPSTAEGRKHAQASVSGRAILPPGIEQAWVEETSYPESSETSVIRGQAVECSASQNLEDERQTEGTETEEVMREKDSEQAAGRVREKQKE